MELEELRVAVSTGEIDSVVVGFTDHYGRTMGKRFDADFFLESCVEDGTHGCDYLLTVDMEMDPVEGFAYANWEKGTATSIWCPISARSARLAGPPARHSCCAT